jgi:hypothetical protein
MEVTAHASRPMTCSMRLGFQKAFFNFARRLSEIRRVKFRLVRKFRAVSNFSAWRDLISSKAFVFGSRCLLPKKVFALTDNLKT